MVVTLLGEAMEANMGPAVAEATYRRSVCRLMVLWKLLCLPGSSCLPEGGYSFPEVSQHVGLSSTPVMQGSILLSSSG